MGQVAIGKANAEHYTWGQNCDGWFLLRNDRMTIIQERMPPGSSETLHRHAQARQFFFILAGSALMEHAGNVSVLDAGNGIEIPPGTPHRILNKGQLDLEIIVTSQPPSHGDRLNEPEIPEGIRRDWKHRRKAL